MQEGAKMVDSRNIAADEMALLMKCRSEFELVVIHQVFVHDDDEVLLQAQGFKDGPRT